MKDEAMADAVLRCVKALKNFQEKNDLSKESTIEAFVAHLESFGNSSGPQWETASQVTNEEMTRQEYPLKPCPFCGHPKPLLVYSEEKKAWEAFCRCGVSQDPQPTAIDAQTHWNSRPEEDRLKELANAAHASLSAQVKIHQERAANDEK